MADTTFWRVLGQNLLFLQDGADRHTVPNSWTLALEAVWYVGFSALFLLGLHRRSTLQAFVAAGGLVGLGAFSLATDHSLPLGRVAILASCVCGLFAYRHHSGLLPARRLTQLCSLVFAAIVFCLAVRFRWLPDDSRGFDFTVGCMVAIYVAAYALFFGLYALRHRDLPGERAFAWLGTVSYSVYLLHAFVIGLWQHLGVSGAMLVPLVFAATLPAAHLTHRFIEEPAIRLGHRIGVSRATATPDSSGR